LCRRGSTDTFTERICPDGERNEFLKINLPNNLSQIGRGMRLSPDTGKEDCRIIDLVDSTIRVSGVVSTPTLFGLDPGEMDINGKGERAPH